MPKLPTPNNLLTIQKAAEKLGVSTKTLRRWEDSGYLKPERTIGNQRRYTLQEIENLKHSKSKYQTNSNSQVPNSNFPIQPPTSNFHLPEVTPAPLSARVTSFQPVEYTGPKVASQGETLQTDVIPAKAGIHTNNLNRFRLTGRNDRVSRFGVLFSCLIVLLLLNFHLSLADLTDFPNFNQLKKEIASFGNGIDSRLPFDSQGKRGNDIKLASTETKDLVLAAQTNLQNFVFNVNVPTNLKDILTVSGNAEFQGAVTGTTANFKTSVTTGKLTAPNVIYSLVAGSGITVSTGQTPTITNTGVLSVGGSTGTVTFSAGTGISISGTTFTNSDLGSAQNIFKNIAVTGQTTIAAGSNTDTLTFAGADGITATTNATTKTVTFSASGSLLNVSGWYDDGTVVRLLTQTDYVGIGTTNPTSKLQVAGNITPATTSLYDLGSSTLFWNNLYANNVYASASGTSGYWQRNSQALSPTNITDDLLLGATATNSALIKLAGTAGNNSWINTGNMGIGTTNPQYPLDVVGTLQVTGSGFTGLRLPFGAALNYVLTTDGVGNASWTDTTGGGSYGAWTLTGNTIYPNSSAYNLVLGSTDVLNSVAKLVNAGSTLFKPLAVADLPTGGVVGTAATTVDIYTGFNLTQTTTNQTITLPNPTSSIAGRLVYLSNTGSTPFNFLGSAVLAGTTTQAMWNGSTWTLAGSNGGLPLGTVNNSIMRYNLATSSWQETTGLNVDTNGNITKINNVATSFPSGQGAANSLLTNDGSGNLTWTNPLGVGASGVLGYWQRTTNSLAPTNITDDLNVGAIATGSAFLNVSGTAASTGNQMTLNANSLSTGYGFSLASTSTVFSTGSLMNLYWNPSATTTATGDLLSLGVGSSGVIGNLLNILDGGSSIFSVSQTAMTSNIPASFQSAGDVSLAYDLVFTNSNISTIRSIAPLNIEAGENFNSSNLTLKTFNEGTVVVDSAVSTGYGMEIDTHSLSSGIGLYVNSTGIITGDLVNFTADSLTTGDVLHISAAGLTTGTAIKFVGPTTTGITGSAVSLTSDIGSGGKLLSLVPDFSGSAVTGYGFYQAGTDSTNNANTDYGVYNLLTLTGNAAKNVTAAYHSITSASTTADTLTGVNINLSATGAITTGTRTMYGLYNNPVSTAASSATQTLNLYGNYLIPSSTLATAGTTNVYGSYITTTATHAADAGTINQYGLYVANGTSSTNGASTKYGLYLEQPTGADTNFALYSTAGTNYFGGNVGIGTTNPISMLSVGATSQFQVNSTGNIVSINNVATSFPASQGAAGSVMTNNGSGTLTWGSPSGTGTLGYWQRNGTYLAPSNIGDSVGIGTTSPSALLDVENNTTSPALIVNQVNTTGQPNIARFIGQYTTTFQWDGMMILPDGGGIGVAGATQTGFFPTGGNAHFNAQSNFSGIITFTINNDHSTSGEKMRIDTNGNVGIGTTNPLSKLDILGSAGLSPFNVASSSGTSILNVAANGYVGIGTTTPQNTLDIFGSVRMRNMAGSNNGYVWTPRSDNTYLDLTYNNPTAVFSNLISISYGGNVGIGTTNPNSMLSVGAGSQFQVNSTGNIVLLNNVITSFPGTQGAAGSVMTNNGSGTLTWGSPSGTGTLGYWQRNGTSLAPSNIGDSVGIGTTSPGANLDIEKAKAGTGIESSTLLTLGITGTGAVGDSVSLTFRAPGTGATQHVIAGVSGIMGQTNPLGSLAFSTARASDVLTEAMRIDDLGNVGIGTTNPTSLFSVGATSQFQVNTSGALVAGSISSGFGAIDTGADNIITTGTMGVAANTVFTGLSQTLSGQFTSSYANTAALNLTGAGAGITFTGTGPNQIITAAGVNLALMPGTTGSLGIGTTAPTKKLDVWGDERLLGPDGYDAANEKAILHLGNYGGGTGANGVAAIYGKGTVIGVYQANANGYIGSSSRDAIVILETSGAVGIGTTTPAYMLDVRGGTVAGAGAYVNTSSYSLLKENYQNTQVLDKISQLRINSWQYKPEFANGDFSRHLYPTTDEFYQAFGLGRNEYTISPEDIAGVALKGVQEQQLQIATISGQLTTLTSQDFGTLQSHEIRITNLETANASVSAELTSLKEEIASMSAALSSSQGTTLPMQGSSLQNLAINDATISGNLMVLGKTTVSNLGVTGAITAGLMTIDGLNGEINTLAGSLKLQSLALGNIEMQGAQVIIDTKGNISTQGTITAKKYNLDLAESPDSTISGVLSSSAGKVIIPTGNTEIEVKTTALTENSLIFVTAENLPVAVSASISTLPIIASDSSEISTPGAFTIKLDKILTKDLKVNWWIIN